MCDLLGLEQISFPTPCTQNVLKALAGNECVVEQSELFMLGPTSENVACFCFSQDTEFFLNSKTVGICIPVWEQGAV